MDTGDDDTDALLRELLPDANVDPDLEASELQTPPPNTDWAPPVLPGESLIPPAEQPDGISEPFESERPAAVEVGTPASLASEVRFEAPAAEGYVAPEYEQESVAHPPDEPRRGRAFTLMLAALLFVAAAAGATWWFLSDDQISTATPAADEAASPTTDAAADPTADTQADGATDTEEATADPNADSSADSADAPAEGEASNSSEVDEPGIDPLTGEPFPESISELSLAELRQVNYPRSVLGADGRLYLRGRTSSQEEIDADIALVESVSGPGSAVNEREVSPGFPRYIGGRIFMEDVVLFDFNSVELDPEALPNLRLALLAFNAIPDLVITVVGFSDSVGSADVNLRISERRAQAVADFWIDLGVDPDRIVVEARGEPAAVGDVETEEASERRVEFLLDFAALS